jgi:hypothetical protein
LVRNPQWPGISNDDNDDDGATKSQQRCTWVCLTEAQDRTWKSRVATSPNNLHEIAQQQKKKKKKKEKTNS